MTLRRTLMMGLVYVSMVAACASLGMSQAAYIPTLQGTTFAGNEVRLPQAFAGKAGVLIVAFTRESQENARAWGKLLAQRYPDDSRVAYYELPVVASVPALLRGWVIGRIRESVAEPTRAHFLPVLDHAAQWKQITGGKASDTACVLVVDASGAVRWHYQGPADAPAFAELQLQVDRVLPG